jgi:hypothetical protein
LNPPITWLAKTNANKRKGAIVFYTK